MATTPPALGYGNRAEVSIDTYNQWQRSQPWYQQLITSFGQSPNNVHLNDQQKQAVLRAAQANGVVVDEGHNGQEVDDSGNFQAKSHALRNTLIVAGIAAAALATAGAAGVFAPAAAATDAAATTATVLPSTVIGSGFIPAITGGTGLSTAATTAAISTAAATIGPEAAKAAAAQVAASGGPVTAKSILDTAKSIATSGKSILDTASLIGNALTANEAGRANARIAQANANAQYDRTAADLYRATTEANTAKNTYGLNAAAGQNTFDLSRGNLANSNAATDLNQRNFALAAPGKRAGNAVRGDILSRARDVTVSGLAPGQQAVSFNGGLRPSMFSDSTKALGTNMTNQALSEQEAGDHFAPLPDLPDYVKPPAYTDGPPAPKPTAMPTPGTTDSILNTASTVANLSSLLSKLPYGTPKPTTPYDPTTDPNFGG